MDAVLYVIACAALAAALTATCWRYRTLRRALIRERAAARVGEAQWARDVAALERQVRVGGQRDGAGGCRAVQEQLVLAAAAAVVDAELAAVGNRSDTPRGGTDG